MSTHGAISTDGAARVAPRIHPGHFSVVACALGLLALGLSYGHDSCADYATKPVANGLLVAALLAQGGSLLYALALSVARVPRAVAGLAAAAVLSVVAVPCTAIAALAINGIMCGGF
jgi:hypothetical protein